MEKLGIDYEHVVIDNNSNDNTQNIFVILLKQTKNLKLF